jgi:hypothetical protein
MNSCCINKLDQRESSILRWWRDSVVDDTRLAASWLLVDDGTAVITRVVHVLMMTTTSFI